MLQSAVDACDIWVHKSEPVEPRRSKTWQN
jgi:hypothetical protein